MIWDVCAGRIGLVKRAWHSPSLRWVACRGSGPDADLSFLIRRRVQFRGLATIRPKAPLRKRTRSGGTRSTGAGYQRTLVSRSSRRRSRDCLVKGLCRPNV